MLLRSAGSLLVRSQRSRLQESLLRGSGKSRFLKYELQRKLSFSAHGSLYQCSKGTTRVSQMLMLLAVMAGLGSAVVYAEETELKTTITGSQSSKPSDVARTEPVVSETAELENEAEGEGAFDPETGEINWDCPCLGGMAHGPCGSEFREAFSCFIYSEAEPKGIECIDRFKLMQDCFRKHPDVYARELSDDTEEAELDNASTRAKEDENEASSVSAAS